MLIECVDCKRKISPRAKACPQCGAPVDTPQKAQQQLWVQPTPLQQTVAPAAPEEAEDWSVVLGFLVWGLFALVLLFLFRAFLFEDMIFFAWWVFLDLTTNDFSMTYELFTTDVEAMVAGIKDDWFTGYILPFLAIYWLLVKSF